MRSFSAVVLKVGVSFAMMMTSSAGIAEVGSSLPDPLSLDYVLRQADTTTHHSILSQEAESLAVQADAVGAQSRYSTEAEINLRARWIDRNELSLDPSGQDHKASINVRKRLYDFGVTGSLEDSYHTLLEASDMDERIASSLHSIELARLYFDVLLSDLEYGWANEAMAMDYVTVDKMRDKFELKQLDEVEMLEEESRYELSLATRTDASLKQRVTRARLAEAMATAGQLPGDLALPQLQGLLEPVEDPETLVATAMQRSPRLQAQTKRVVAARKRYEADSNSWMPSLSAELEVAEYSRDIPSRDDWKAGLNLQIPIFENGMHKAQAAQAYSLMKSETAELKRLQSMLRSDLFRAWQNISTLIVRSKALAVSEQYAFRALDKSRGEYELELRTDFGDAQVRVSRARLDKAEVDYRLAIEKMKLALMLGEDPVTNLLGNEGQ